MRKTRKPELCVQRIYMNEKPVLDLIAEAYKAYFEERERTKSSIRTFDLYKSSEYNGLKEMSEEDNDSGTAA